MKRKEFSPKKKDRVKIVRGILEGIILIGLLVLAIKSIFTLSEYSPYEYNSINSGEDNGFITISYFGVDRNGTNNLISTDALENQLKALKENGYVTITQQDVLDYYNEGKKLPPKALLLLFEDGRTDTAIFSQKIMEKYNFKATMLTYADKLSKKDSKFLKGKDLEKLVDSTYWELGTNGYRLEYINVFDNNQNYLGELTIDEFVKASNTINRDYNHYLMDYIRDENNIPKETYSEMKARIQYDYTKLEETYNDEIGTSPNLYVLMHSNTGKFGTNDKVSDINEMWIKNLFAISFNRAEYSLNTKDNSIYDLTRIQPQAYWPTNHLLMKIFDDTKNSMDFVIGNEEKAKEFEKINGEVEFKDDTIILTSLPKGVGTLKLLGSNDYKDINLSVELNGNIIGSQAIYLRSSEDLKNNLRFRIVNNTVKVTESIDGKEDLLYSKNLSGDRDIKDINISEPGSKKVNLQLIDNKLNVTLDGEEIIKGLEVRYRECGSILLESSWGGDDSSKINIHDDIYDGVFKNLKVSKLDNTVLFDTSLKGTELIKYNTKNFFKKLVNWFITNL
ncbi:glycoside hydrolase [Clostridium sp. HCS.1]|uniref:glycoside hydrolase n=1 Tax=Clostridium sp. HCS.1 TaxID=3238594 RepID=UPI003A1012B5